MTLWRRGCNEFFSAPKMAANMDFLSFAFSFVVLAGGVIGYLKAGSTMSLMSGIVFGLILALGASQTSHNPKNVWISLAASVILCVVMGMRFFKTGKVMPAGMVFFLSIGSILRHAYNYYH
ncbi:transmembrane protein 14C-like [Rhopilema esculentum]|uniref:transmembrane protein 14C-like n=1 Tax=Rhopilema esculentum TaxID=499914 RepID=UPI0031D7EE2C